jgi:hypothetical protein
MDNEDKEAVHKAVVAGDAPAFLRLLRLLLGNGGNFRALQAALSRVMFAQVCCMVHVLVDYALGRTRLHLAL